MSNTNSTQSADDVCEHLRPALDFIRGQGAAVKYVGTPWSRNCRTWVYFENCVLDVESIRARLKLPEVVEVHTHRGTHDGSEHGLYCSEHHDALMGMHPDQAAGARTIR